MAEQAEVAKEKDLKSKLSNVVRWIILSAALGFILLSVVMAAYRKFGG